MRSSAFTPASTFSFQYDKSLRFTNNSLCSFLMSSSFITTSFTISIVSVPLYPNCLVANWSTIKPAIHHPSLISKYKLDLLNPEMHLNVHHVCTIFIFQPYNVFQANTLVYASFSLIHAFLSSKFLPHNISSSLISKMLEYTLINPLSNISNSLIVHTIPFLMFIR